MKKLSRSEHEDHKKHGMSVLFLGLAIIVSFCPSAYATPTSYMTMHAEATFFDSQDVTTTSTTEPLSGTLSIVGAGYAAQAVALTTGGISPGISVSVAANGYSNLSMGYVYRGSALGMESLDYYYMIKTPDPYSIVPVTIHAVFEMAGDSGFTVGYEGWARYNATVAFGNTQPLDGSQNYYSMSREIGDLADTSTGANGVYQTDLTTWTNTWNLVRLQATAQVYAMNGAFDPPTGVFANVSVDPTITIDATWLDSHPGSTLEFDTFAVPEPGTLLLLGPGLATVAAFGRRFRK